MIVAACNLLEVLSILLCISYLYNKKFHLDIATVSVISIDLILMQAIAYYQMSFQLTLLIYPVFIGYCMIHYGSGIKKVVVNTLLYLIILLTIQYIFTMLIVKLFKINHISSSTTLIINFLLFLFVLFILSRFNIYRISNYLCDKGRLLIISIGFCFASILICLVINKKEQNFDYVSAVIILISALLICTLAANLGKYRMKSIEVETELKMHQLYEKSFVTLIENIRMRQHEFDNHINAIYSQHHIYKTYQELVKVQEDYCHALATENYYNKLLSAGNSVIIGFLYGKFIEIEKSKIEIFYKVNIQKMECRIPIYKIIELLGDLINNAVDALEQTKKYNKLYVSVLEMEDMIRFEVRNESPEFHYEEIKLFFEKGYSQKGHNRGLGLYNVSRICKEYDCRLSCENMQVEGDNWISFVIEATK